MESRTTIRGPDVVMDCMWQVPEARKAYETVKVCGVCRAWYDDACCSSYDPDKCATCYADGPGEQQKPAFYLDPGWGPDSKPVKASPPPRIEELAKVPPGTSSPWSTSPAPPGLQSPPNTLSGWAGRAAERYWGMGPPVGPTQEEIEDARAEIANDIFGDKPQVVPPRRGFSPAPASAAASRSSTPGAQPVKHSWLRPDMQKSAPTVSTPTPVAMCVSMPNDTSTTPGRGACLRHVRCCPARSTAA